MPELNAGQSARDLAGDKRFAAQRRLVVEQDAARNEQPVALAIAHDLQMGRGFGDSVGTFRAEGGRLANECAAVIAETLAGTGVEEPAGQAALADAFEQIERAVGDAVQGFERLDEGVGDRGLAGEVVDLVRVGVVENLANARAVGQDTSDERNPVHDAEGNEIGVFSLELASGAPDDVALVQQKLGQVGAILPGDTEDQSFSGYNGFGHDA